MMSRAAPILLLLSLVPTAGVAWAQESPSYTIEDVTACSADAMRLCRDKMPDIGKIEDCMKEKYELLRPKCRARFDRGR